MGSDKFLQTAIGVDKDSPEGQRLTERRRILFARDYLPQIRQTRGASTLLQHLRAEGLNLVVASSAECEELEALLAVCGASDLISDTAPGKEPAASKPVPDVVTVALRKLGVPPAEAVMLGDTPYDVEAATQAGVACIALRSGGGTMPSSLGRQACTTIQRTCSPTLTKARFGGRTARVASLLGNQATLAAHPGCRIAMRHHPGIIGISSLMP